MINSDKITFAVFEVIEDDKFLPINKKISLDYLDNNMDGIFENGHAWLSFINGNFLCQYDRNNWRESVKESTIKNWCIAEKEYKHLFVVKTGKDSYINVPPEDINLAFSYELGYRRGSAFPTSVEIFVIATIKD